MADTQQRRDERTSARNPVSVGDPGPLAFSSADDAMPGALPTVGQTGRFLAAVCRHERASRNFRLCGGFLRQDDGLIRSRAESLSG